MGARRAKRWWWLCLAVPAITVAVSRFAWIETDASASTQQCNTDCQSRMTDCILSCDGIRSCEEACKRKGESCVAACSSDAGPMSPVETADASVDATSDRVFADTSTKARKDAAPRVAPRAP